MRVGKLSEATLQRAVLRQIRYQRDELQKGAALGRGSAFFQFNKNDVVLCVQNQALPISYGVGYVFYAAVNNLKASFAEPVGIEVSMTLPVDMEEEDLKKFMQELTKLCLEENVALSGGHTSVSSFVKCPIVGITAFGTPGLCKAKEKTGCLEIVMSKPMALSGTSMLFHAKQESLLTRFRYDYVEKAAHMKEFLSLKKEWDVLKDFSVYEMHDLGEGGVFGGLWELTRTLNCGIDIDIKAIPVCQETIEICEFLKCNPYRLHSLGSLLIVSRDAEELKEALCAQGCEAEIIGKITDNKDKKVRNDDEISFLDKTSKDSVFDYIL